jgi:hypothetical protein
MPTRGSVRLGIPVQTILALFIGCATGGAQELGGAGTVQGTVKDPTGGVMVAAAVSISNPVSGFRRETTTDQMGRSCSAIFRRTVTTSR